MDTIGRRLIFIRTKLIKQSREEFIKSLGISAKTLERYEQDTTVPDSSFLSKLIPVLNKFNYSLDWLLTGEGSPQRSKEIEFEVYNLVSQSEDGEATYRTSWGFMTKSEIEKTLKIPLGGLDDWLAKHQKVVMEVRESIAPYGKDPRLSNLIDKLEHIYNEGTAIERGQIRGIIEELYEDIKKKETLPGKEVIEQKKVG